MACPICGAILQLRPGSTSIPYHMTPQRNQCSAGGKSLR